MIALVTCANCDFTLSLLQQQREPSFCASLSLSLSLSFSFFFFSYSNYDESPRSSRAAVSKLNENISREIISGEGIRRKTRNVRVIKAKGARVKTALPFDANRAAQTGLLGEKDPISFFHFPPLGAIRRAEKRIYDYN